MAKPDYKALYLASYTERQELQAECEALRAKLETVEPEYVGALCRIVAAENRARRAEDRVALLERQLENVGGRADFPKCLVCGAWHPIGAMCPLARPMAWTGP